MAPLSPVKNVVLVHGAFVDGSGWRAVYDDLTERGYRVTIVQNPLTSLAEDHHQRQHPDLLQGLGPERRAAHCVPPWRPLTADDWDSQMLFFLSKGYRVVAFDRRGQGRSTQTDLGHDMDTFASDTADIVAALDLQGAVHIGHSTGGGVVARYVARAEPGRVSKAILIGAITPILGQTASNPTGVPLEVFDGFRTALAENRAQFYLDIPSGPFDGFNRDGAKVSEGLIQNWWRQGMAGSAKAQLDTITAFSETDFTEDLKSISVPVLVLHGEDDQIVPVDETARRAAALLPNGSLKTYPGLPHGLFATHPDLINTDLLAFIGD